MYISMYLEVNRKIKISKKEYVCILYYEKENEWCFLLSFLSLDANKAKCELLLCDSGNVTWNN